MHLNSSNSICLNAAVTGGCFISFIPVGGIREGDLSSLLTLKLKKGEAIDKDHRVTKQQYTTYSLYETQGGRKTSCMACQQKKIKLQVDVCSETFRSVRKLGRKVLHVQ